MAFILNTTLNRFFLAQGFELRSLGLHFLHLLGLLHFQPYLLELFAHILCPPIKPILEDHEIRRTDKSSKGPFSINHLLINFFTKNII